LNDDQADSVCTGSKKIQRWDQQAFAMPEAEQRDGNSRATTNKNPHPRIGDTRKATQAETLVLHSMFPYKIPSQNEINAFQKLCNISRTEKLSKLELAVAALKENQASHCVFDAGHFQKCEAMTLDQKSIFQEMKAHHSKLLQ